MNLGFRVLGLRVIEFRVLGLRVVFGAISKQPLQSGHRLLRISFSTLRAGVFLLLSTLLLQATPKLSPGQRAPLLI